MNHEARIAELETQLLEAQDARELLTELLAERKLSARYWRMLENAARSMNPTQYLEQVVFDERIARAQAGT